MPGIPRAIRYMSRQVTGAQDARALRANHADILARATHHAIAHRANRARLAWLAAPADRAIARAARVALLADLQGTLLATRRALAAAVLVLANRTHRDALAGRLAG